VPLSPLLYASDINAAGQVVGSIDTRDGLHPAAWTKGVPTDLGKVPNVEGFYGFATAINTHGQVVGYTELATQEVEFEAFLWEDGVFTDLGVGIATDINPAGQVVGSTEHVAWLWQNGVRTDLWNGQATGINPAGRVVGETQGGRAVLLDKGVIRDLGTLGGSYSKAENINPAGQVVGWSYLPGDSVIHAFLWEKGVMRDLGTLGGQNSFARGINPAGQVVGQSATDTSGFRAFVWDKGVMSELVPLEGDVADAVALNPAGEVVGNSGGGRATLWTRNPSR
jgi:probable HAF family extracellular repeat protein